MIYFIVCVVAGIRVDAVPVHKSERAHHGCVEVMPDATSAVVSGLAERTEYDVIVTSITNEYFDQLPAAHETRRSRHLSKRRAPADDVWLPRASIRVSTSGTIPPTELRVTQTKVDSVTLTWKRGHVSGSNRLMGHIVRWAEGKFNKVAASDDTDLSRHKTVHTEDNKVL